MSNLILTFNAQATEKLGSNTRIRVKTMKRGGVEYVALRPSYRVSGKNAMIRTSKGDDGMFAAELPEQLFTDLTLPALKNGEYLFDDVGYGWFLLKGDQELNEKKDAIITVSKSRKHTKKAEAADGDTKPAGEEAGSTPESDSDTGSGSGE